MTINDILNFANKYYICKKDNKIWIEKGSFDEG